jgi:ADP-glucose pyrophosphorylase
VVLEDGEIKGSIVADGSVIDGLVLHSSIGYRVQVRKNARIEDSVVFSGVVVGEGSRIKNAVVNKDVRIPPDTVFEPDRVTILDSTAFESKGNLR